MGSTACQVNKQLDLKTENTIQGLYNAFIENKNNNQRIQTAIDQFEKLEEYEIQTKCETLRDYIKSLQNSKGKWEDDENRKLYGFINKLLKHKSIKSFLQNYSFNGFLTVAELNNEKLKLDLESTTQFIPVFKTKGKLNDKIKQKIKSELVRLAIEDDVKELIITDKNLQNAIMTYFNQQFKKLSVINGVTETKPIFKFFNGTVNISHYNEVMTIVANYINNLNEQEINSLTDEQIDAITAFYILSNFDSVLESLGGIIKVNREQFGKLIFSKNKYTRSDSIMPSQVFDSVEKSQSKEDADNFIDNVFEDWFFGIKRSSEQIGISPYNHGKEDTYFDESTLHAISAGCWRLIDSNTVITYKKGLAHGSINILDIFDSNSKLSNDKRIKYFIDYVIPELELNIETKAALTKALNKNYQYLNHTIEILSLTHDEYILINQRFNMCLSLIDFINNHRINRITEIDEHDNIISHSVDTEKRIKLQVVNTIINKIRTNLNDGIEEYYDPYFIIDDAGNSVEQFQNIYSQSFINWFYNAFGIDLQNIFDINNLEKVDMVETITGTVSYLLSIMQDTKYQYGEDRIEAIRDLLENTGNDNFISFKEISITGNNENKRKQLDQRRENIPNFTIQAVIQKHQENLNKLKDVKEVQRSCFFTKFQAKPVCKTLAWLQNKQASGYDRSTHITKLTRREMYENAIQYFFQNMMQNKQVLFQPFDASDKSRQFGYELNIEDVINHFNNYKKEAGNENKTITNYLEELAFKQYQSYYGYISDIIRTNAIKIAKAITELGYNKFNSIEEQDVNNVISIKQNTPLLEIFQKINNLYIKLDPSDFYTIINKIQETDKDFQFVNDRDYTEVKIKLDNTEGKVSKYQLNTALIDAILTSTEYKRYKERILDPSLEATKSQVASAGILLAKDKSTLIDLIQRTKGLENDDFVTLFGVTKDELIPGLKKYNKLTLKYTENSTDIIGNFFNRIIELYFLLDINIKDASMITIAQSPLMHSCKNKVLFNEYIEVMPNEDILNSENRKKMEERVHREAEARYDTSTKRGNINVATIVPYRTDTTDHPSQYLPKQVRFAVIKSLQRDMTNFQGDENKGQAAHDGASLLSGPFALMQTWSCQNGYNITGSRKNLGFGISIGRAVADKCAGYPMDNEWIRGNSSNFDVTGQVTMHNKQLFLRTLDDCQFSNLSDDTLKKRVEDFNREKTDQEIIILKDNKYYKVGNISVADDGSLQIEQVNLYDKTDIITVTATNLAKLWEAAGAEYSMEYTSDGQMLLSEGSMELITKYMCYVEPDLKNKIIGEISLSDTIKSGVTNVNPEEAWSGEMRLNYSYMPLDNYGVQNDNSHEADESELAQPSQVISGIAFNGVNIARSSQLYEALSKLIDFNSLDIKFTDDESKNKVLLRIAKQLLGSFKTSKQLSNAQAMLAKILEETSENGDIQVSFSTNEFFNKLASNLLSQLNKTSIKNQFPGTAAVLNPSNNIKMLYTYIDGNGQEQTITSDDIIYLAQEELKIKEVDKRKSWVKDSFDTSELISNFLKFQQAKYEETHKEGIEIADIHIGDNIKYKKPRSKKWTELFVKGPEELVKINNLLQEGNIIIRDLTKPRDLRPQHIIYEEDGQRKNFWLADEVQTLITARREYENDKNNVYKRANYKQALANYRKFLTVLSEAQKGTVEYNGKKISNVINECGEQIVPKVHRTVLGIGHKTLYQARTSNDLYLQETNLLYDLLDTFNEQEDQQPPSIIKGLIDAQQQNLNYFLLHSNDYNIYVTSSDIGSENTRIFPQYDENGDLYFYDNQNKKLFRALNENSYLCIDGDAYIVNINYKNIGQSYRNYIKMFPGYDLFYTANLSSELSSLQNAYKKRSIFTYNGEKMSMDISTIIDPSIDYKIREAALDAYAEIRRQELKSSFEVSLDSVSLRIPSQSYQSFMAMKTVAFIDRNTNDCYTNIWQIWFQGSDFDIDKNYTLMYGMAQNGIIDAWSPLFDYTSSKTLKESMRDIPLPDPTKSLIKRIDKEGNIILKEQADGTNLYEDFIKLVQSIIDSTEENGEYAIKQNIIKFLPILKNAINPYLSDSIFKEDNYNLEGSSYSKDEDFKNLINTVLSLIDSHNNFQYSKTALKNKIISIIYDAATDMANLEHSTQPMSAQPFKDALNKLKKIKKDDTRTEMYSAFRQYDMILKNAVGKTCVGIFANGIKVNSTLQQYYNEESLKGREHSIEKINAIDFEDGNKGLLFKIELNSNEAEQFENAGFNNLTLTQEGEGENTKYYIEIKKQNIKALSNLELTKETIARLFGIDISDKRVQEYYDQIKGEENVADALSILISLATDNAKELFLEQINCNPDTAKGLIALFSLGFTIEESLAIYYFKMKEVVEATDVNRKYNSSVSVTKVIEEKAKGGDPTWVSLQQVFKLADEMTSLAQIFSINRGVEATYIKALNMIERIKRVKIASQKKNTNLKAKIKEILNDPNIEDRLIDGFLNNDFNLSYFLYDITYQKIACAFSEATNIINIFDVLLRSSQYMTLLSKFNETIQSLNKLTAISSYIVHKPIDYKIIEKGLPINNNEDGTPNLELVNQAQREKDIEIQFKDKQKMWHHYVISEFLKDRKDINFEMSILKKSANNMNLSGLASRLSSYPDFVHITLDNDWGVRMFKEMVDDYIAKILMQRFKDNSFVKALQKRSYNGIESYNIVIPEIDIMSFRRDAVINDMAHGFNDIARIGSGFRLANGREMTVGELLFFYDLITSKRQLGTMLAVMDIDSVCTIKYDTLLQKKYKELDDLYSDGAIELLNGNSKAQQERIEKRDKIYQDLDCRLKSVINKGKRILIGSESNGETISVNPRDSYIWTFKKFNNFQESEIRETVEHISNMLNNNYPNLELINNGECKKFNIVWDVL